MLSCNDAIKCLNSGNVPPVALEELPAFKAAQEAFMSEVYKEEMFYCKHCKERWFKDLSSKSYNEDDDECASCVKDMKVQKGEVANAIKVCTFSGANDGDPYNVSGTKMALFLALPTLTESEKMLISRIFIFMKCY